MAAPVPADDRNLPPVHAGVGDVRGGEGYLPLIHTRSVYLVDRVFMKAGVRTVIYWIWGGRFDGHCGEAPLGEFVLRVRKPSVKP